MVDEVVAAGLLGHRWWGLGDLDVLQVQQPQLHLHAQQGVQVTLGQLAGHVLPQEGTEAIDPDAVLWEASCKCHPGGPWSAGGPAAVPLLRRPPAGQAGPIQDNGKGKLGDACWEVLTGRSLAQKTF